MNIKTIPYKNKFKESGLSIGKYIEISRSGSKQISQLIGEEQRREIKSK